MNMNEGMDRLPRGRPRRYSQVLDYEIMRAISEMQGPVGSGTLEIKLRRRGYHVSAATVGRKLRELEVSGYLLKITVRGRALTDAGREYVKELEREVNLQYSSEALHRLLTQGSEQEILDLLEARRILEREIIELALRRATDRDIARIEQIVVRQQERVAAGELAVEEDMEFHDAIAEIGGNTVLRSLLAILRRQGQYAVLVPYIRRRVGGRLAVDHLEILEAMRQRDVTRAQAAVDEHMRKLMRDVDRYWRRATREGRRRSAEALAGRR
jgi:GntR family transcriptional repressor for pyruvate dehydrogenase complex